MKILLLSIISLIFASVAFSGSHQTDLATVGEMAKKKYGDDCPDLDSPKFEATEYVVNTASVEKVFKLPCSSTWANIDSVFFIKDVHGDYKAMSFREPKYNNKSPNPDVLGYSLSKKLNNASFDPKTGVITSLYQWRGLGDISSGGTWKLTGDMFELKEYRVDNTKNDMEDPVIIVRPKSDQAIDLATVVEMYNELYSNECVYSEDDLYFEPVEIVVNSKFAEKVFKILCTSDAHNRGHVFFIKDVHGEYKAMSFPMPDSGGKIILHNAAIADTGEIVSYSKWRGLGDISSGGTWKLTEYGYVLTEYRIDGTENGKVDPTIIKFD